MVYCRATVEPSRDGDISGVAVIHSSTDVANHQISCTLTCRRKYPRLQNIVSACSGMEECGALGFVLLPRTEFANLSTGLKAIAVAYRT